MLPISVRNSINAPIGSWGGELWRVTASRCLASKPRRRRGRARPDAQPVDIADEQPYQGPSIARN